jgi:hypothetical protein
MHDQSTYEIHVHCLYADTSVEGGSLGGYPAITILDPISSKGAYSVRPMVQQVQPSLVLNPQSW